MLNIYDENIIILDLEADTKDNVIDKMSCILEEAGRITSVSDFKDSIYERENENTTEIGNFIAIPHGRSVCVRNNSVCIAILEKPVIWNSNINEEVDIIFMLAVKADSTDEHIDILSELASKIIEDDFTANIKKSRSRKEIYQLMNNT